MEYLLVVYLDLNTIGQVQVVPYIGDDKIVIEHLATKYGNGFCVIEHSDDLQYIKACAWDISNGISQIDKLRQAKVL